MTVLVADDSLLSRKLLMKTLREVEPDVEVIEAQNGVESLEKILAFDPQAKVVIVSADIQPKSQERVMAAGAKSMLPKPMSSKKMRTLFLSGLV